MTGKRWTTNVQADFLQTYMSQYLDAQAKGSLSTVFWPLLFREWFRTFPEKELVYPDHDALTQEQEAFLKTQLDERRKVSGNCHA
jgi:hypothetical protein